MVSGRILVVRGGAIGDFVLTLPAITALRKQFPEAHLEVLGYPHIVQLALAAGLVDRVQSIEARALAGFFARGGNLSPDLADYFSEFDLVLSYLYDPDGIFRTNVGLCTGAQFIQGPHRPDEDLGLHATRVYLKPLERLAIFDSDHQPRLSFARGDGAVTGRLLALHPGSGSERKNWPEQNWAAFVRDVIGLTDLDLLMVGGEAEGVRLQRLAASLPAGRLRVAQSLPLVELATLLEGCTAFVGHDSGISHLAAAVGLPGVLLWGETREDIWRPPSDKMIVVRHPRGLGELEVAVVLGHLRRILAVSDRAE